MHYKDFLFENSLEQTFKDILKLCPFMNLSTSLLQRGMKRKGTAEDITPRTNRKPLDTSIETHNALDKAFEDKFGKKLRSSAVFVTMDRFQSEQYGEIYYIFPLSESKFYHSDIVNDLNNIINNSIKFNLDRMILKGAKKFLEKWEKEKYNLETPVEKLMRSEHLNPELMEEYFTMLVSDYKESAKPFQKYGEQMLICDRYIAIRKDTFPSDVLEYKEAKIYMKNFLIKK